MTTDSLEFLLSLERLGMKFGLENISRLCAALGHPERAFQSIVVAGTNGKGSVTAMVHRGLTAAGHLTGRYTSPHLERLEERYAIGGREVETGELRAALETVRDASAALEASGSLQSMPTFFEAATAAAFVLFRRSRVPIAVLEVGLGGRLDATNVVSPIAAAITSIDFDHEAQLGSSLEAIAFEKAGIIKRGIPAVCGKLPAEAEAVVRTVCRECAARFVSAAAESLPVEGAALALRGSHQVDNARVATRVLRELRASGIAVDEQAIERALTDVRWPGRLERFRYGTAEVLIDAAHNPAGARALTAYLRESGWGGCALVFGAMQDKNVEAMLAELSTICGAIICTTPATPRALAAPEAARIARVLPDASWTVTSESDPAAALASAAGAFRRVVVAGSIFLVGPLRGILRTR